MIWFFFKHLPAKINKISHICKQKMPSHEDFAYLETSFAYFESRTPKMLQIIKFCKFKMLQIEKVETLLRISTDMKYRSDSGIQGLKPFC